MMRILFAVLALIAGLLTAPAPGVAESSPFPRPAALEPDVQFWIRVYTEVDTKGGLIHDSRNLGVVYEAIRFPASLSSRSRERRVDQAKKRYKQILQRLARGKRSQLSKEERRVLSLFPEGVSDKTLSRSAGQLRFQLGQADKFRAGLIRSGAWEPHIRKTMQSMGLPIELAALPHVESSYTPHAYSRVGAAGLWQFTRSTGRRFMRVDHVVDERLDPYRSTIAAARLLEQNKKVTGTWPLAITAYNHGASGMRNAARKMGTSDITTIVRNYKSRTFGFASRNFYVEFLAAADVDFHSARYFGALHLDQPIEFETFELGFYTPVSSLANALGVELDVLKQANLALRPTIWNGTKRIPKGYAIRVPRDHLARPTKVAIAEIPADRRYSQQTRDKFHTVGRGDTLSGISSRYRVSVGELVRLNGLRSRHRIRIGQKIRLPDDGTSVVASRKPAPRIKMPVPESGLYTVRRGDTLSRIADRFEVDERELARFNGLRSRNRIQSGQVLRLTPASSPEVEVAMPAAPTPPAATPPSDTAGEHPDIVVEFSSPQQPDPPGESEEPGLNVESETADLDSGGPLLADPSDYSVASDGTIEVQVAETLGHYAEWLGTRASRLRQINNIRYGTSLSVGRKLRLDFRAVPIEIFESRRIEYHRGIQEAFFADYEIEDTLVHVLKRGDSLWVLAERRYKVPLWLLRQYNPDLDFQDPHAGTRVTVPRLKRRHG